MDKILKALNKARKEEQEPASQEGFKKGHAGDSGEDRTDADSSEQKKVRVVTLQSEKTEKAGPDDTAASEKGHDIDSKLIVFHEPESLAAEHFKLLRSRFVNPPDGKEYRTILVTSAMDNAGKTLVACNLALSIAQGVDPYALLVDSDIRKPSVHKLFGLDPKVGLSEYLTDKVSLPNCLVKSVVTKLTLLPAGNSVPNPAEIVISSRMKELLREAKSRYHDRYIIIDSPPVNLASETVDLAKLVDAVLLVVRSGVSSKPLVEQAINRIGTDKIIGFVFNGYERPSGKYGYYRTKNGYYG